jgi:dipeptidyl aminopeptidase/acylaminoacyl peptidase
MNGHDTLERELVAWFGEIAAPSTPDYTDAIVQLTAGRRQRPRWTFLERWLPMSLVQLHPVPTRRFPWRTVGLVAVIAALLIALLAVAIGSWHRVPAPFGLAGNGLMAYASNGDIWVVDPATGSRRAIVTGPEEDHDPRWSRDGTRVAFLRETTRGIQVVIVAADGGSPSIVTSRPLADADSDSLSWAPDGHALVVAGASVVTVIDALDGHEFRLPIRHDRLEAFWRPPDGRELVFVSNSSEDGMITLTLYTLVGGGMRDIQLSAGQGYEVRPMGWTPDGSRLVLHRWSDTLKDLGTSLFDPETGASFDLDVEYGHVSNAGDRIAGFQHERMGGAVCVIDIRGGRCVPIGRAEDRPLGPHAESVQWSPDDRYVVVEPESGATALVLDPVSGGTAPGTSWVDLGAESWQRTAP